MEIPQFQLPLTLIHARQHPQRLWSCLLEGSTASTTSLTPRACPQYQSDSEGAVGWASGYQQAGPGARGPVLPHHSVLLGSSIARIALLEALSIRRDWESPPSLLCILVPETVFVGEAILPDVDPSGPSHILSGVRQQSSTLPAPPALLICMWTGFWIDTHASCDTCWAIQAQGLLCT